ncbi:MAG: hypothetical protein ACOX69_06740 [Coriobacteriales bacterium]
MVDHVAGFGARRTEVPPVVDHVGGFDADFGRLLDHAGGFDAVSASKDGTWSTTWLGSAQLASTGPWWSTTSGASMHHARNSAASAHTRSEVLHTRGW